MTVKKSPNVASADCPASNVLVAVVDWLTTSKVPSSARTIEPIPTTIDTDTTARAIGPKAFMPLTIKYTTSGV